MKRDTLKTFAGLLIIGVIVVATFLYGNSQRQNQLKHDQDVKNQQEAAAGDQAKTASPSASTAPAATTTPSAQANTAPVQSPSTNKLQSPGTPTPTPAATHTPTPSPAVAGAQTTPTPTPQTVPVTGGSALPDTGAPVAGLLGAVGLLGSLVLLRRSKKSLAATVRTPR